MSYRKGQVRVKADNKWHVNWQSRITGEWGDDIPWAEHVPDQRGRTIDHPEEEWTFKASLPHSCDEWEIGGVEEIVQLIADLGDALAAIVDRETLRS